MSEKILITGANGFIGANLVRRLLKEKKYKIFVFLRKTSNTWRINNVLKALNVLYVDLLDFEGIKKAVKKIDPKYIFHLATYGSYPELQKNYDKIIQTNIIGTYNLLKATAHINYKCFINTGSSSEYGIKHKAMSEGDVPEPVNIYGASKASASMLCQTFSKIHKKNIVTLRPFSVYGPYEESFRFIPHVIMNCLKKKKIKLTSGEQKRDFIFVDDFIDIYLKVMDKEGIAGEILNGGTGRDSTVKEVAKIICRLTNSNENILGFDQKKMRKFEAIKSWRADISKIRKILNYTPKHSLEEGLEKTINWLIWNKHPYEKKDIIQRSD